VIVTFFEVSTAVEIGPLLGALFALFVEPGEHAAKVIVAAAATATNPTALRFVRHDLVAVRLP
jgi:hypothetical protein